MKFLAPMNEYGIFADVNGIPKTTSLRIAEFFEKNHQHVLRDIENLDCSPEFNQSNFGRIKYKDIRGRNQPAYEMTKNGFMFLVMGYTGAKAAKIKEEYIKRFDEMESFIASLNAARGDFDLLTDAIRDAFGANTPSHIYSNEINMLNKLVTGMTAKQFKEKHNIEKGGSIRPYLTQEQLDALDKLQRVDIGFLEAFPNYQDRKLRLTEYYNRLREMKKLAA